MEQVGRQVADLIPIQKDSSQETIISLMGMLVCSAPNRSLEGLIRRNAGGERCSFSCVYCDGDLVMPRSALVNTLGDESCSSKSGQHA
jgi:hypothetical protein